jgi:hypothetical protein
MKNLIKKIIEKFPLPIIYREFIHSQFPIIGINYNPLIKDQKKVLISYVNPLYNGTNVFYHTNVLESFIIIQFFIEDNYEIDIIPSTSSEYSKIKNKAYDIIFGFGEPFRKISNQKINILSKKILYLTESSPDFSLMKEKERIDYFYKRHKKRIKVSRSNLYLNSKDLTITNSCILIGNDQTKNTYKNSSELDHIHCIQPSALFNTKYIFSDRNISHTKNNFLWFGSNSFIHRGLDLLIETFKNIPEGNLFICGYYLNDEKNIKKLIGKSTNIHLMGSINVQSNEFLKIINNCSFIISASCSEGMSTSVLTCMKHAMIPVITKETGIDINEELGFVFEDYKIEYLLGKIKFIISKKNNEIQLMHQKVFNYSKTKFTLKHFDEQFRSIILRFNI